MGLSFAKLGNSCHQRIEVFGCGVNIGGNSHAVDVLPVDGHRVDLEVSEQIVGNLNGCFTFNFQQGNGTGILRMKRSAYRHPLKLQDFSGPVLLEELQALLFALSANHVVEIHRLDILLNKVGMVSVRIIGN